MENDKCYQKMTKLNLECPNILILYFWQTQASERPRQTVKKLEVKIINLGYFRSHQEKSKLTTVELLPLSIGCNVRSQNGLKKAREPQNEEEWKVDSLNPKNIKCWNQKANQIWIQSQQLFMQMNQQVPSFPRHKKLEHDWFMHKQYITPMQYPYQVNHLLTYGKVHSFAKRKRELISCHRLFSGLKKRMTSQSPHSVRHSIARTFYHLQGRKVLISLPHHRGPLRIEGSNVVVGLNSTSIPLILDAPPVEG